MRRIKKFNENFQFDLNQIKQVFKQFADEVNIPIESLEIADGEESLKMMGCIWVTLQVPKNDLDISEQEYEDKIMKNVYSHINTLKKIQSELSSLGFDFDGYVRFEDDWDDINNNKLVFCLNEK